MAAARRRSSDRNQRAETNTATLAHEIVSARNAYQGLPAPTHARSDSSRNAPKATSVAAKLQRRANSAHSPATQSATTAKTISFGKSKLSTSSHEERVRTTAQSTMPS